MSESPGDVLRRAAARIRERAQAAKEQTGDGNGSWYPWGTVKNTAWADFPEPREVPAAPYPFGDGGTELADGEYKPTGEAFVEYPVYAHDGEEDWLEPHFFAGPMPEPLAVHVASWHPGVALAVADLLDKIAWMIGLDAELAGRVGVDETLAVARAYLGEQDTTPTAGEGNGSA